MERQRPAGGVEPRCICFPRHVRGGHLRLARDPDRHPVCPGGDGGYYAYWSFCKTRRGYSGTLCLSRYEALRASYDLRALLFLLEAGRKPVGQKHHKLYEYFRANDADPIALTFGEIEGIMGEPLGKSARQKQFWQRTGFLCISQCWLMNGYRIARLRLREGTVEDKARPALAAINRKNGCPVKPVPTHPLV